MRVLIVENEIYLAQSIASKLGDVGHECEIVTKTKDALKESSFDVVLLSTSMTGQNIYPVIEKYKNAIIILLITYISNDTVSNPIKAGASDYIQKPFMIEELIRKIEHFEEYKNLKIMNKTYMDYIDMHFNSIQTLKYDFKKLKFPLFIRTAKPQYADSFVFSMMRELKSSFVLIPLNSPSPLEKISKNISNQILYLPNFQVLKNSEKEKLINYVSKQKVIISTTELSENLPFETINIACEEKGFETNEILKIDDYVKYIITTYQNIFPDTELSKRLGISRKSLWEKRKKYDITKKK